MLYAFIDESGDRGQGGASTPHFVMSAVVVRDKNAGMVLPLLEGMRAVSGRMSGQMLSFKKMKAHQKAAVTERLARARWLRIVTVVVCKEQLADSLPEPDLRYMYTFRLLLERLSWLGLQYHQPVHYTLAHLKGFKKEVLVQYEERLRRMDTAIKWEWIAGGGSIDQPKRLPGLQVADTAASAAGSAFNPHQNTGVVTTTFLTNLHERLWVPEGKNLTSYGLKMHPWNEITKAAYPWVAAL